MNFSELRQEVLDHGFDPIQYSRRINRWLNDANNQIARRVDYYVDEAVQQFPTVAGTSSYAWPADFARMRSLFNSDWDMPMQSVLLTDIDDAGFSRGAPSCYAVSNRNVLLFPTPDGVYNLEMRYWKMPTAMVADTDVPAVPDDYTSMLWIYAVWLCYEADDDAQMGQYWKNRWDTELSQFAADQKFPNSNSPRQVRGMWDSDELPILRVGGGGSSPGGSSSSSGSDTDNDADGDVDGGSSSDTGSGSLDGGGA